MSGLVGVVGSQRAPPNAVRSYGIRSVPPPPDDCAPADESGPETRTPSVTPPVSARGRARAGRRRADRSAALCAGRRAMSRAPQEMLRVCRTPPDPAQERGTLVLVGVLLSAAQTRDRQPAERGTTGMRSRVEVACDDRAVGGGELRRIVGHARCERVPATGVEATAGR